MWYRFKLQVEGDAVTKTISLKDLHDSVVEWVSKNKTRTVKICLRDGVYGRGKVTWESLHDVITFAFLDIKFRSQRDATLFKMFFSEHITDHPRTKFDPVILPLIRRAMPSIIAADIIGVSPMTGPTASIYSMRVRYQETKAQQEAGEKVLKKKQNAMQKILENAFKGL